MKIVGSVLAFCAVATAFQAQGPKSLYKGKTSCAVSQGYSAYLGQLSSSPVFGAAATGNAPANTISDTEQSPADRAWETSKPITIQGGALKTWSFASPDLERVQVVMKTEGRPLDADLELWQGPDNTPTKMRVYVEDGSLRTFSCYVECPNYGPNTVAIRNIANMEFPIVGTVVPANDETGRGVSPGEKLAQTAPSMVIQGGALRTYNFDPVVKSVQVMLKTDGRPLNARIELLQGPNNNKEVIELYTEDGMERPFYAIFETPGSGNVVRVVNTATVEFPMTAWVEPFMVGTKETAFAPILSGDAGSFMSNRQWS